MTDVLARLRALQQGDLPTHGGSTLAYVYDSGLAEADEIGRQALALYGATNGLDPTVFPSLRTLENDLVGLGRSAPAGRRCGRHGHLGWHRVDPAGRPDRARRVAGVAQPSMVLPSTAHAAFHKAAHYFGVRAIVVESIRRRTRLDPEAMAAACDDSTVLMVASAPSYAHGVVDPIPAIASAAAARGIRCHVDACIGGWVLPYLRADGVEVAPFDFAVPGCDERFGGSAQVRVHAEGRVDPAAPDARAPAGAVLRARRLARLHDAQLDDCSRPSPAHHWPPPGPSSSTSATTATNASPVRAYDATLRLAEAAESVDGLTVLARPATTLGRLAE